MSLQHIYELAAIQAARSVHARGSCFLYTWYAWLFQHPKSFIFHWQRPTWAAEVAPPICKLWPEYLDESSPREVAMCFIWLTKVTLSRALPWIWKNGASGEDHGAPSAGAVTAGAHLGRWYIPWECPRRLGMPGAGISHKSSETPSVHPGTLDVCCAAALPVAWP